MILEAAERTADSDSESESGAAAEEGSIEIK